MTENVDMLIKMLDISLEGLPLDQKIAKIRKLMNEMQDLLQNQKFREGLASIVAKHFEKQATLPAVDIVLELIQKSENPEEKAKYIETLHKIVMESPILENKEDRIKLTAKLKDNFPKQGEEKLIDIILKLTQKAEDIPEITQHAETLKTLIKGADKEPDLIDYIELKRNELPQWKLSILIKGLVTNKNKILLEAARGFLETIKELNQQPIKIEINICEILNKIRDTLGERYYTYDKYYRWGSYYTDTFKSKIKTIVKIIREAFDNAINEVQDRIKNIEQKIGSQLSILTDLSKNALILHQYLGDLTIELETPDISSIDDFNKILKRKSKIIYTEGTWGSYYIYVLRSDHIKKCKYELEVEALTLDEPDIVFDFTFDGVSDLSFVDGLVGVAKAFAVFIAVLLTASDDAVRREILAEMLRSDYDLFVKWALWVVGNVYLGTVDRGFKDLIVGLDLGLDVVRFAIWSLAMLGAGSNDLDIIKYIVDRSQRLTDNRLDVLSFALGLVVKHPINSDLREKLKALLSSYARDDPKYFLELIYAMFRGGRDYEIARWVREVISTQIVDDESLSKVIASIIS